MNCGEVLKDIQKNWDKKHEEGGIFKYKLQVKEQRILAGNLKILVQVSTLAVKLF